MGKPFEDMTIEGVQREGAKMTWWRRLSESRPPDYIVGEPENPYLCRWWVIPRNKWGNIYLHQFLRSDEDRALHDHMYVNLSYLLEGEYVEHTIAAGGVHSAQRYQAGDVRVRLPRTAHRIEVDAPCWSLFVTGPRVREWGFHCPRGWRHWREFVNPQDTGTVGRGCD
jgi:hypothetical protein